LYGSDPARTLLDKPTSLPKALVAAVGVGLAFGAGFVVGGIGDARAEGDGVAVVDVDPVVAAATRTKLYEERVKGLSLTWHQELNAVDALPSTLPPPAAPKVASLPVAEEPSSAPIVDKAVVAAADEPPPPPKRAAPSEPDHNSDDESDAKKVKSKPNLDAAIGKVLGDDRLEKAAEKASTTPEKRYALQLGSTGSEAGAKVLADGWAARGHKVSVVAAEVAGKGTMYRVRIGGIASRAAADALKAKLGQGLVVND
jgi:cell division septation protein DedD